MPKIKPKPESEVLDNPKKRLGTGEKKALMEMATVSVTTSLQGAQNIMDIRAVKINGDMEDFMEFRIKKEQLTAF